MQPSGDASDTGASQTLSAERKNALAQKYKIFGFTELLSTYTALRCKIVKEKSLVQSHVSVFKNTCSSPPFCPSPAALSLLLLLPLLVLLKDSVKNEMAQN